MARSIRRAFYQVRGRIEVGHWWGGIDLWSAVSITASEVLDRQNPPDPPDETSDGEAPSVDMDIPVPGIWPEGRADVAPYLGAADIWVSNVGTKLDRVEYVLHVNWERPLNVAVTITDLGVIEDSRWAIDGDDYGEKRPFPPV